MQKKIQAHNVTLWTESFGKNKNKAVLLIAGAMAPALFWPDGFCKGLAQKGFFVIRFDHRDIGYSTHFPPACPQSGLSCPYHINDLVKDLCAILKAYKIKRAHFVGHSMGGLLVQLAAIQYPHRLLTATAICTPLIAKGRLPFIKKDEKAQKKLWAVLMSNPLYFDYRRGKKAFFNVWKYLHGTIPLDKTMAHAYTKRIYATETIEPAWNHMLVQKDIPDQIKLLRKNTVPLLFIQGQKDLLAEDPQNVAMLAKIIPQ